MVGVSPLQKAQRAFVTVLLRLAAKYCLQLGVTRDSSAKELTAAFRKVARRTHPDKGGTTADTQALNAAREAWVAPMPAKACMESSQVGRGRGGELYTLMHLARL